MSNTIGWGKGTQNNTNGWGKYQNTIDAGSVYADSYAGETVLVGTSAAFSYSKSSFHQDESDPTPTITGTTGGTFSATPSGLSINTSTGTIDLDNSTIQSYTITYTVSGVSANQTLAVTASPFIANNFSMQFDGTSVINTDLSPVDATNGMTLSLWLKCGTQSGLVFLCSSGGTGGTNSQFNFRIAGGALLSYFNGSVNFNALLTGLDTNTWNHIVITVNYATGDVIGYKNTVQGPNTLTYGSARTTAQFRCIGAATATGLYGTIGKIDEVALWTTVLSTDAITEIYNATANNTGKVLDLNTDTGNYTSSANLQYWNRLGD